MRLMDILSDDKRIIVLSSKEDDSFYTWNQSCTLQYWEKPCLELLTHNPDCWNEEAIQTLSEQPSSFAEARKAALEWRNDSNKLISTRS